MTAFDVGQIRTDAPEGTRFLVLRDNHSATTPLYAVTADWLMVNWQIYLFINQYCMKTDEVERGSAMP